MKVVKGINARSIINIKAGNNCVKMILFKSEDNFVYEVKSKSLLRLN